MGLMDKQLYVGALLEIKPQEFDCKKFKEYLTEFIARTDTLSNKQRNEMKKYVLDYDWEKFENVDMLRETLGIFDRFVFPYEWGVNKKVGNLLIPNSNKFSLMEFNTILYNEGGFVSFDDALNLKLKKYKYELENHFLYTEVIIFLKRFGFEVNVLTGIFYYELN